MDSCPIVRVEAAGLWHFIMFPFFQSYLWVRYQTKPFENMNPKSLVSLCKSKNQRRKYQNKHGEHMIFKWLLLPNHGLELWVNAVTIKRAWGEALRDGLFLCGKQVRFKGDIIIWSSWRRLFYGFVDEHHLYQILCSSQREIVTCWIDSTTLHTNFNPIGKLQPTTMF